MNKRTEILKQFGRNVKAERVRKGLTQEALAERMNINSEYISKVERGMANMSLKKIAELADYIGADINDLLRF
ncbi:helix-turn-helix transcriptional regulator [Spirochaetes bacterium]|uniref:Helix-turn-helix transcriptional regulator n=1 Tax=Candidatus Scatousia excrementipullorum TaxID=2840936 RepID=A0A9D9DLS6_9BACT|nr:helix-turn-helix transcriptional regulator [Candidatus Scatousia excrementipullorum]